MALYACRGVLAARAVCAARRGGGGRRARRAARCASGSGRREAELEAREAAVWRRTEALWEREQALWESLQKRWDAERAAWDSREAALAAELAAVQAQLAGLGGAGQGKGRGVIGGAAVDAAASASIAAAEARAAAAEARAAELEAALAADAIPPPDEPQAPPAPAPEPEPAPEPVVEYEPLKPWPALAQGADDVWYVHQLHVSLYGAGFGVSEEDEEEWFFGETTLEALLTFQAINGLGETGYTDEETWEKLCGPLESRPRKPLEKNDDTLAPAAAAAAAPAPAPPLVPEAPAEAPAPSVDAAPGWPVLKEGDDNLFWVAKLHAGLTSNGFAVSGDDEEMWTFGESTRETLLTFQACSGLAETGVTDKVTWVALLGDEANGPPPEPPEELNDGSAVDVPVEAEPLAAPPPPTPTPPAKRAKSRFPILREEEGGMQVHALQILLQDKGYSCGEDDEEYWHFGYGTDNALKTFQCGQGLPETGVADDRTWLALLGEERFEEGPDCLVEICGGEDVIEQNDISKGVNSGMVYLIGEDRWERRDLRSTDQK